MNASRTWASGCAAVVCMSLIPVASADVWLDDGGNHVVDYPIPAGQAIRCEDGREGPTTLEYAEGASVTESVVYVFGTSRAQVTGGRIEWVLGTYDDSHAVVRGGDINTVHANDSSTIHIDGGWVRWYLFAGDHGEITMTGGTLDGSVEVYQDALVTLKGGTIVDHGDSDYLWAGDNGTIYVHGVFNYEPGPIQDTSGQLVGTLKGGCHLDVEFKRFHDTAQIIIVSEPTSISPLVPVCGMGAAMFMPMTLTMLGLTRFWIRRRWPCSLVARGGVALLNVDRKLSSDTRVIAVTQRSRHPGSWFRAMSHNTPATGHRSNGGCARRSRAFPECGSF